jgi:hypothetical protein
MWSIQQYHKARKQSKKSKFLKSTLLLSKLLKLCFKSILTTDSFFDILLQNTTYKKESEDSVSQKGVERRI